MPWPNCTGEVPTCPSACWRRRPRVWSSSWGAGERHADSGLVLLCHPWESGADNDPRWDDFCEGGFDERRWFERKGELLGGIVRSAGGAPLANPRFAVASAGFSALVAFNALDLADATGAIEAAGARRLADAVRARWDNDLVSYTDAGDAEGGSGRARTAYGLLGLLVEDHPERAAAVAGDLGDSRAYGGAYGPAGVHRGEPAFAARTYWRGPSWPQINYLLWLGLRRAGQETAAQALAQATIAGGREVGPRRVLGQRRRHRSRRHPPELGRPRSADGLTAAGGTVRCARRSSAAGCGDQNLQQVVEEPEGGFAVDPLPAAVEDRREAEHVAARGLGESGE